MGLMALPNIIALIFLSGQAVKVLRDYDKQMEMAPEHLTWEYKYENMDEGVF